MVQFAFSHSGKENGLALAGSALTNGADSGGGEVWSAAANVMSLFIMLIGMPAVSTGECRMLCHRQLLMLQKTWANQAPLPPHYYLTDSHLLIPTDQINTNQTNHLCHPQWESNGWSHQACVQCLLGWSRHMVVLMIDLWRSRWESILIKLGRLGHHNREILERVVI